MEQGEVQIYSGDGHGKSSAALGRAVQAAAAGKEVIFIQFLKGLEDNGFMKRLEPEIKFFRFEKSEANFNDLPEKVKADEIQNIKNGLNFAKKVLATGVCDLLVMDEVLGLIDNGIITVEDLKSILDARSDGVKVVITGIHLCDAVGMLADEISKIETIKI